MQDTDHQILMQLRDSDRSLYLTSLLMPETQRLAITTIFAFHAEIGRIRQLVRDPLPGEIRLQWWREVTADNARKDEAAANPLARALGQVIDQYGLSRATFDNYCRARIFDLYDDPMPDIHTYEGYAGETYSMLFQWCCQILSQDKAQLASDVSGHGGVAMAVANHLTLLPRHVSGGQVFIPVELLVKHNLGRDEFLTGADQSKCAATIDEFIGFGRSHLEKARQAASQLPSELAFAYLQLNLCDRIFRKAEKLQNNAMSETASPATWLQQWDLWRGTKKGMF